MSVLIKGLDMPKGCLGCPCINAKYNECMILQRRVTNVMTRMTDCPLIELPDHGDLIDRDALMARLGMAMDCEDCPNRTALYFCGLLREMTEVCDELESAPVVIPAERSEASLCICDNCDQRNDKGCSVCKYIVNERSEDGET